MATTSQLRDLWAPACTGPFSRVELHGEGSVLVRASILPAVAAFDACLKAHNYRTRAADTGAYNCRKITGGTRYSLHAYGIALDLNWTSNPYGRVLKTDMPPAMVADIKAIRTRNGKQVWRWGGDYSGNKDAMHFEICCSPADIASGIASPAARPAQPPATTQLIEEPMYVIQRRTQADQRLLLIEDKKGEKVLYKGHGDAVTVTAGTPVVTVDDAIWNDLITRLGPVAG